MRDEAKERLELLSTIQDLGYESLRFSIFNDHRPSEWETRIDYNLEFELYEVYSTMDRASTESIFKFKTFEEAKEKFIHNLKITVFINKTSVENGEVPEYSSPLWDKIEADIENMKCIVEQEIKKRHFESLQYVLFDENKNLPFAFHLFYKDSKFMINLRDDRSYIMGNTIEFDNFEEAKTAFISKLEHFVESTRKGLKVGFSPYYSSPLWDEKEGHQKLRDEAKERLELISTIQDLGYESLRYSIFNDHRPREWETRIEYNPELEVYEVYSTMDRASMNGKDSYQNFQEARSRFIEILENVVFINRYYVDEGIGAEYSSPLWDKSMIDIENMKCIVEQEIKKRHFESLHYVLFDETKRLPWAFHLYQKNGKFYVDGRDDRSYIVGHSKEYDNFESAKKDFFEKLELVIESNKLNIQLGLSPEYPSPLWDEKEGH